MFVLSFFASDNILR